MGRSVDQLSNATEVWFMHPQIMDEDQSDGYFDWDEFKNDLIQTIQEAFPSLQETSRWDGRETQIILENTNVEFGIAEYCGLVSLGVRPRDDRDSWSVALGERWIKQVTPKVSKLVEGFTALKKVGTFSNGECVYQKA